MHEHLSCKKTPKNTTPRVAHWWQTFQTGSLWSTSTTNAALKMSRHSLDVLTWPHSQLASDFMGGGSLHQPPPTDTALLYACSRGWLGWKSGHFDLANTPGFGKEVNDAKLQNKSATRKAVITACCFFFVPLPLTEASWGIFTVTNSCQGCCSTGGLLPEWLLTSSLLWNPEPKLPARVAVSWCAAMKSALFYSYQPTQSVTKAGSVMRYKASSGSSCSSWEAVQK